MEHLCLKKNKWNTYDEAKREKSEGPTKVLTLFDDIVAEDTEHGTENGVVEEKKESKNSHGLLRLRGGQRV